MATTLTHQACPLWEDMMPYSITMANRKHSKNSSPAFFQGEFSFVNKDANNIESKDHNAAVSWHVMNRYERFKKQQQARKLRASANVPISSNDSLPQQRQGQSSGATSQHTNSPVAPDGATSPTAVPSLYFDAWLGEPAIHAGYGGPESAAQVATNSPFLAPNYSSPSVQPSPDVPSLVDPVSASITRSPITTGSPPIKDSDTGSLISFAYETFLPGLWPTEPGNPPTSYEISRSWDDISLIGQDDCYRDACLALLSIVKAEKADDHTLRSQSRQYQSQVIRQLRHRMSSPGGPDLFTQKAILHLFSCETCVGNTAAARTHLKTLRKTVAADGGVILLDPWFREELLSCDCYFAIRFGTRPVFPAGEWTPGPLSQPWKARLITAGIFGDQSANVDKRVEHPTLKALITDLRELFKTQEYILDHDVQAEDQVLRWRQLRKFDCISRLADHYTNLAIYGHLYDNPKCQIVVTIVLVLLTNMVLGSPEPVRFGSQLLDKLREAVQEAESELTANNAERLLLWVYYVGSLGERIHPQPKECTQWFNDRMKQMARQMGLNRWEDIRKVIRYFLFSTRLHEEVVSGRAHRSEDFCTGLYSICGTSWRAPLILQNEDELGQGSVSRSSET